MQHIYMCEYVHNNAIQNTYTAIFEYSYCHLLGVDISLTGMQQASQHIFSECCAQ